MRNHYEQRVRSAVAPSSGTAAVRHRGQLDGSLMQAVHFMEATHINVLCVSTHKSPPSNPEEKLLNMTSMFCKDGIYSVCRKLTGCARCGGGWRTGDASFRSIERLRNAL